VRYRRGSANIAVCQRVASPARVPCNDGVMFSFKPDPKRPFFDTLFLGVVLVATMAFGAVVLWAVTGWLWLVVHEGLH